MSLSPCKRNERFRAGVGVYGYMGENGPTGANHHPDRCVCQGGETTPHKHRGEHPHSCARCVECKEYRPAVDLPEHARAHGRPSSAALLIQATAECDGDTASGGQRYMELLAQHGYILRDEIGAAVEYRAEPMPHYDPPEGHWGITAPLEQMPWHRVWISCHMNEDLAVQVAGVLNEREARDS